MDEEFNKNFFDESLRLVAYCPLCNQRYNPLEAKVIDKEDNAYLIYVRCRKCQGSIVALVLSTGLGVSSTGLVTDLNSEDLIKFKEAQSITIDNVIDLHEALEGSSSSLAIN